MRIIYNTLSTLTLLWVIGSCSDDDPVGNIIDGGNGSYQLVNAFPNLEFSQPVLLTHADDGSDRLYVVERIGRILSFENSDEVTETIEFLNLEEQINTGGLEQGLLSVAFHPNFRSNGQFYVNYIGENDQTVISRFNIDESSDLADPDTERILLEIEQPFENHNGGMMAFGNDGYLYIATGDGGSGGDPQNNSQTPQNLLGNILRLDVDQNTINNAYGIPPDNPFVNNGEGIREEVFAYGLRNPWRFSIDPETGDLWAGDVGQNEVEEIDLIVSGGNYGWNILEGSNCFRGDCDPNNFIGPVTEYGRSQGESVTGGYVYRGVRFAELLGLYFYADFSFGTIWTLDTDNLTAAPEEFMSTDLNISSFGVDAEGELYILDFRSGGIFTIR